MFDYSFTVAYISAKETSILTKEALSRIAADRQDSLRLLTQTGYGGGADGKSAGELTDNELSALRRFVMDALPEELYSLLILPYDAHNVKVLLKCRINGADPKPYLYDNTMFDTEIAAACCRGGEFSLLSETIAKSLNAAFDSETLSLPFGISTECDKAFYTEISERAKAAPEPIAEYISAEVDGKNFMSYLRAKNIGLDASDVKALFLPGGSVPPQILITAYAAGADELRAYTFGYDAHYAFCDASDASKRSFSEAADVLDLYVQSKLEPYKYEPEHPAPVFLYFKKKTAEARHIREAFAGTGGAL